MPLPTTRAVEHRWDRTLHGANRGCARMPSGAESTLPRCSLQAASVLSAEEFA